MMDAKNMDMGTARFECLSDSKREVMDGYLIKKGAGTSILGRTSWRRRFCMLSQTDFRWHEDIFPHDFIKSLPVQSFTGRSRAPPWHTS